ncbi:PREDICTED: uncharacterized protein LOC104751205 [Camelina sativa]|uniref:Uncharacterized protein LOC104751205 n=1 Tax=Camelina sativa TaxID=90675 RepID=A0ABM0WI57_CAMSA|nr:PREDICTED: uncharacterized protein LOC104751205 [Camelina sativa]
MGITRILSVVTIVSILYSVQVTAQIFGEVQEAVRCVTKLLPCQPYIHLPIPPSSWCCAPMKEIVEKETTCLCAAFNHPDMLRFIALTKETALNLLSSCGIKHDLSSVCTRTNASSPSSLPEAAANGSSKRNAALGISFLGYSFVSAFFGMILL